LSRASFWIDRTESNLSMIAHIRGKLVLKAPTHVVIENQGIGFHVLIPFSSYTGLGEIGSDTQLLTHLHVREDALQLFGFVTPEERDLFLLLISVSGVGPKLGQGILSGISVENFKQAVQHQDQAALSRTPGVGKKTAERLILELKDKIGDIQLAGPAVPTQTGAEEAILALISLGYKRAQVQVVVQKIFKENPSLSVEEVIKQALQWV